jgi:serine protease Do
MTAQRTISLIHRRFFDSFWTVVLTVFLLITSSAAHARAPESVADLAEGLIDSVVNISTSQTVKGSRSIPMPQVPEGSPFKEFFEEFFDQQFNNQQNQAPRRVNSLGSGFIIDSSGIIVTNYHVIEGADEIEVIFNDGSKLDAEILGRDDKTDIAVLKVEPSKPLKALSFEENPSLRVGDWVMAIGNPFGLGGTVTVGIVSAMNRDIGSGPYDAFIQTDASINRGNSGGPLFNMDGEVIGINTAIISPSGGSIGIGFAVPSETAKEVIAQLREFGETRRGWLGVRIQSVTEELAEGLGLDDTSGALVAGVTPTGPAEEAGIERGDVIIEFNGEKVQDARSLPRMVAAQPVGKQVDVVLVRKGERQTLSVELGRLEEGEKLMESNLDPMTGDANPQADVTTILGLTLSEIDQTIRERFELPEDFEGVVILAVDPNSTAASKRVQPGQIILEVAQQEVMTPQDILARLEELKAEDRKQALLLIQNKDDQIRFVALPLEQ